MDETFACTVRFRPKYPAQLCWDCAKATGGGDCEWAKRLTPVPGWEAEMAQWGGYWTWSISACPKFEEE